MDQWAICRISITLLQWRLEWFIFSCECLIFICNFRVCFRVRDTRRIHCLHGIFMSGTYQVQTNLSVQTMETSIWAIGSIFKGCGGLDNFTIWTRPWIGYSHFCKSHLPPLHPPLGCWSTDSDWSFHSLHVDVVLHLICSRLQNARWFKF